MLPYTVNSPRVYKSRSVKARQNNTLWIFGVVALLLTGIAGLWYLKSKSAHVTGLLAVITEHGMPLTLVARYTLYHGCRRHRVEACCIEKQCLAAG